MQGHWPEPIWGRSERRGARGGLPNALKTPKTFRVLRRFYPRTFSPVQKAQQRLNDMLHLFVPNGEVPTAGGRVSGPIYPFRALDGPPPYSSPRHFPCYSWSILAST